MPDVANDPYNRGPFRIAPRILQRDSFPKSVSIGKVLASESLINDYDQG